MRRRHGNQKGMFMLGVFAGLICMMTVGYAAFSTTLNINVKGNLKDVKTVVDNKIPKEGLIFWGQADNTNNTNTTLEDKSESGNNMTLNGAVFDEEGLLFDGVDDYGLINNINYNNTTAITIDFVAKIYEDDKTGVLFESSANFNQNNGTFLLDANDDWCKGNNMLWNMHYSNGYNLQYAPNSIEYSSFKHYTVIFDSKRSYNNFVSLYLNGISYSLNPISKYTTNISNYTLINYPLYIASRAGESLFAKIKIKEVVIYNRALTEEEINIINEGYKKKYELE